MERIQSFDEAILFEVTVLWDINSRLFLCSSSVSLAPRMGIRRDPNELT